MLEKLYGQQKEDVRTSNGVGRKDEKGNFHKHYMETRRHPFNIFGEPILTPKKLKISWRFLVGAYNKTTFNAIDRAIKKTGCCFGVLGMGQRR